MSRQDDIAQKAVRKSTLKSLKAKKHRRLVQLKADYEKAVQDINIQYAEDPERLKAKYAAADYAKSEKAKRKAEKKIENEKKIIAASKKLRPLTLPEEIASSIVQGIGATLFIAATAVLDTVAVRQLDDYVNTTTVFYTLFGASMILMYLFSLLQHALTNFNAKTVFNRLAHVWTFLIIGFGYSVYTITKIQGIKGWILFGFVWAMVIVGALFYAIAGRKYEKLNIILCAVAGFSGTIFASRLYTTLPTQSFTMLILGGAFYLIGLVFYSLRKVAYMHLIGNILMLFGSVYIFFSLFFLGA
ncbi:MAG: hemolysin III family protein [Treponema sp.]|nr:hemolysin III family protein [Treponema sp.]